LGISQYFLAGAASKVIISLYSKRRTPRRGKKLAVMRGWTGGVFISQIYARPVNVFCAEFFARLDT
jgi:hypothetical protein